MLNARLFGPLELDVGARRMGARDLGGAKPRRLLSILLLERGHPVPKDRLAELLWADSPPVNVGATLDTYASTLRRHLDPDRGAGGGYVVGGGGGLRIPRDRVEVDLDVFDDLVAESGERARSGDPHGALESLESALGVARGQVLEDEPYASWALRVRERYAQRVLDARLAAAELALDAGEATDALGHALAVLDADPLREAAHRVVMLAYYRLGRQDESLRAFNRCRQALADELGVDPLPETVDLHTAVLRRDPELPSRGSAPVAPRLPPPSRDGRDDELPFLGRTRELAQLLDIAARSLGGDGDGGLVAIEGEAGIGKSRLIAELLDHVQPGRLGVGTCAQADRDLPYVALAAALRELRAVGVADPSSTRPGLAEILPELPAADLPAETARIRALEALAALLRDAAPVTVVIDDLQWADASTIEALAYLQRRLAGSPVLLIVAYRPEEVEDDSPVGGLDARVTMRLGPLSADDLAPLGDDAATLFIRSGGHPLWLGELVRAGGEAAQPVPARLVELIVARCRRAGPQAHRLLAAASVLGRPFSPELAAALVDDDPLRAAEQLDELVGRGLVRPVGSAFGFRHDLIGAALAAGVSPARRRLLHGRAVRALERTGSPPGELAGHAIAAGMAEQALRWSLAAARQAATAWANVEAAEHYRHARELADELPDLLEPHVREAMLVEYGRVLVTLHRVADAEAVLREARASAEARGDERAVFAAVEGLAVARQRGASDPVGALELGREGLATARQLGDVDLLARAHTLVGSPSGSLGLLDDEIAHCTRAVTLAEEYGRTPPAYPMGRVALGLHHQGREREALEWAERAEAMAVRQHDEETLLLARWVRALASAALGRTQDALRSLDSCATVGRGEEVFWHARMPNTYGSLFADICQYEAAVDRDHESLEVTMAATGGPVREAEFQTRLNLAADHLGLGEPDAAAKQLAVVRAGVDDVVYARFRWLPRLCFLEAELAARANRPEEALAAAQACLRLGAAPVQRKYSVRGRLAEAMARLAGSDRNLASTSAVAAAREAEELGLPALAWRAWWLAHQAGSGDDALRKAQSWVLRAADGLDDPLRSRFLTAVPVPPSAHDRQ